MEIVAYRGELKKLDDFIERLRERNEITTQDILAGASIALVEYDRIDYQDGRLHDLIKGIKSGSVTLIDRKTLPQGAQIKKKPTTTFPNHAELSGISAEAFFTALKQSGVHFDYVE